MSRNTTKAHKLALFIFRRDLRLEDNTGLFHSLRLCKEVVPCFVFDKDQIDPSRNSYFTNNQVQFMIESLKDLDKQLRKQKSRVFFFHGEKENIFNHMIDQIKPDAVFVNEDYTAYSKQRDKILMDICEKNSIKFYTYNDIMLIQMGKVLIGPNKCYQKFTPFYNACLKFPVPEPEHNNFKNYYAASEEVAGEYKIQDVDKFYVKNDQIEVRGGTEEGLKILDKIKNWKDYQNSRDYPANPTTKLSAYNKFGCVSVREVYHAIHKEFGGDHGLIRQLYWRDFYYIVANYNPHVFGHAFRSEYENAYFSEGNHLFEKWTEGKTGCPIVDAGMRNMNTTGYMPNRLRLITSIYLIKDMLVDWRKGEQYFAQKLVDYDASQNNGNWQWSAGCGADAQPYFRIFNPKLQSEKYDKEGDYIKMWVPELKDVSAKHLHDWDTNYTKYKGKGIDYPDPIVFHDIQKKKCLKLYKKGLYGDAYEEADDAEGIEVEQQGGGEEEKVKGKLEKKKDNKKTKGKAEESGMLKKVKKTANKVKKVVKKAARKMDLVDSDSSDLTPSNDDFEGESDDEDKDEIEKKVAKKSKAFKEEKQKKGEVGKASKDSDDQGKSKISTSSGKKAVVSVSVRGKSNGRK